MTAPKRKRISFEELVYASTKFPSAWQALQQYNALKAGHLRPRVYREGDAFKVKAPRDPLTPA
jgi:hypothetical protein